jgi:hypothetical protein
MEDIKKIQEFFSKPLNENKVTKEDFDKVVKILSKSKYPFTIMLVPKWDEIDIITGQDSPDEIVDDIGQRLDSAGLNWGGNSGITISGDSSNYSRREYSDIFRVNGGHKDYYEESVNEYKGKMPTQDQVDKFFALTHNETHYLNSKPVAGQEATFNLMKIEPWDEYDLSNWNSLVRKAKAKGKSIDEASRARVSKPRFKKDKNAPNFLNVYIDYDLGPGGALIALGKETMTGQIRRESAAEAMQLAGDIARDLEAKYDLEDIDIQDLKNGKVRIFAVSDDFIDMDPNMLSEASEEEENEFHKKLDKLVHKTFGHSSDEKKKMEENALGMTDSRLSSDQHVKLDYAVRGDNSYTFGNDPYADDQLRYKYAKKMGFLQESSSSEERRIAKRAIRSIAKYRGVSDDEARNDLIRAAKELGNLEENMSLDDQAKAYFLAKVKSGEIDTLPENPKAAFLAQMTKDQIDHDKETLRRERGLEEKAAYIAETIKLGLMLNEELCDKGKRYIKARQAAGEKSSAYLSGRAVRVCKGQIEWPKKGKK